MDIGTLTVNIEVKQRSMVSRLARLPRVFWGHYKIMRRGNGRIVSAYGAWLLAGLILTVQRAK
jgi:hypothetical protein